MKNIKIFFFWVMLGPYIQSIGYQGHQNVSKCSPHHSGDRCTTRGQLCIFDYSGGWVAHK